MKKVRSGTSVKSSALAAGANKTGTDKGAEDVETAPAQTSATKTSAATEPASNTESGFTFGATHWNDDAAGPVAESTLIAPRKTLTAPEAEDELESTIATEPATAASSLRGAVDESSAYKINGWAWDPQRPDERIVLELVEDDRVLLTASADLHRPDLLGAGIGDAQHGFVIELQPGLLSSGPHVLHLRCSNTGAPVPGSPIELEIGSAPAFRWSLDEISDQGALGWIAPLGSSTRNCVMVLRKNGVVLARSVASRFREDLLAAGIGDGCHAFFLPMPRSLLDGNAHLLEVVEEESGFSLTPEPVEWLSTAGSAGSAVTALHKADTQPALAVEKLPATPHFTSPGKPSARVALSTRVLFDLSDLIYYVGHHRNLTGIQRVQSSIVLAMMDGGLLPPAAVTFLSFNARTSTWISIPSGFLVSLLRDLFLPESQRLVGFPEEEARYGVLPGAQPFDGEGILDDGTPSVLCMLGAAWVNQDYVRHVLAWKRQFGTRFVMTVHDLIPIYARDSCDQGTALVFESFMRRALPHVDHILSVSENTANDIRRYMATLKLPVPPITVTKNGSSFAEFMPAVQATKPTLLDLPKRFVLFVATIEGRKNHRLIFDIWKRMVEEGEDPPHLICVGRLGWKATTFISDLVESNYLNGYVHLFREVSDTDLQLLYQRCLFTVSPTFYEGWGLPVGESLAMGKICVCSNRSSIPEVAGDCGVYIDIDSAEQSLQVIRDLIRDQPMRKELEAKIQHEYVPITWEAVAGRVVKACKEATRIKWQEPYPFTPLPYGTEISFGKLDQEVDGVGEIVLTRILDARGAHFLFDALDRQSFLLGEAIRGSGAWAQPERWGTWLCHGGGNLVFVLPPTQDLCDFIFIRLRVCPPLHEQPIQLTANGERLWEGKIGSHPQDLGLRWRRRGGSDKQRKVKFGVHVNLSPELVKQIAALDGRVPTVGFERMIIIPESDYKTRLNVLSKDMITRQRGG